MLRYLHAAHERNANVWKRKRLCIVKKLRPGVIVAVWRHIKQTVMVAVEYALVLLLRGDQPGAIMAVMHHNDGLYLGFIPRAEQGEHKGQQSGTGTSCNN